jgi:hypothetical protein
VKGNINDPSFFEAVIDAFRSISPALRNTA